MTEAQGTALLLAVADLQEMVRLTGYFLGGIMLAVVFATTWRG